jgi:hypothetical protein
MQKSIEEDQQTEKAQAHDCANEYPKQYENWSPARANVAAD